VLPGLGYCAAQQQAKSCGKLLKLLSPVILRKKCKGITLLDLDGVDEHFTDTLNRLALKAIEEKR